MSTDDGHNLPDQRLTIRTELQRVGLLRVEVSGAGDYANTIAYWRTIVEAVHEHHPRALLLIDLTTGPALKPEEWKSLVDAMSGSGLERLRIAHVKPRGLQQIEYCELYAREAGFTARVFTDEGEAGIWLRYGVSERTA
jgi:hypothetical protein